VAETLAITSQLITHVLVASSVHALLIVGLAYLAMQVARHRPARVRYHIGHLSLLMVAGVTAVTTVKAARVWRSHESVYASVQLPGAVVHRGSGEMLEDPVIVSPPGWSQGLGALWLRVPVACEVALGLLWLALVLLVTLRVLAEWLSWRRVVRAAASAEPALVRRVQRLAADMGIRAVVHLLVSEEVRGPLVVGVIRPRIVIGRSTLTDFDAESLELLLRHELAHVRRHDAVAGIATLIPEILFFFHPAVRWLVGSVRHERECACDEQVTEMGWSFRRRYARALYRLACGRDTEVSASAVGATGGRLLDRVRRIVSSTPPAQWNTLTRLGFQAAVGAFLLLALSQAGAAAAFAGDIMMRRDMTRRLGSPAASATGLRHQLHPHARRLAYPGSEGSPPPPATERGIVKRALTATGARAGHPPA